MTASRITELEACPFCGGLARHEDRHNPMSRWRHSIDCTSTVCGMSGPVAASVAEAVALWNRRAVLGAPAAPEMPAASTADTDQGEEAGQGAEIATSVPAPAASPPPAALGVEEVARIIDPHSFLPHMRSIGDEIDEMIEQSVQQSRELARRKATQIIALLPQPSPEVAAAPSVSGVRIKPLEWRDEGTSYADSALGTYSAWPGYYRPPGQTVGVRWGDTRESAKAGAQIDHDRRLRASPASEATPVAGEAIARNADRFSKLSPEPAAILRDPVIETASITTYEMCQRAEPTPPAPTDALKALSDDVLSHAQMLLLAVEAGDHTRELAMRVKDLIAAIRAKEEGHG